jgi:hypothetical protein
MNSRLNGRGFCRARKKEARSKQQEARRKDEALRGLRAFAGSPPERQGENAKQEKARDVAALVGSAAKSHHALLLPPFSLFSVPSCFLNLNS